jgi:hypothetical protein
MLISLETARRHMSQIGDTLKALRWIPHALTCELKQIHLSMRSQSLPKLRPHAHANWRHLITGTTAGIITRVFEIDHGQRGMKTCLKSKQDHCIQQSILTVSWNPHRFHVVTVPHPRASFNASWFTEGYLVPLVDTFFPAGLSTG